MGRFTELSEFEAVRSVAAQWVGVTPDGGYERSKAAPRRPARATERRTPEVPSDPSPRLRRRELA